jgi:hypothetical protein
VAKKKKKAAPKQPPVGAALAAGIAALRESMKDPETQRKIAANFAKLKPQAEAAVAEMRKRQAAPRDKVAEEYDLKPAEIPSVEGTLRLPDKFVPREGRHDFYWLCETATIDGRWDASSCVKASYWREDSVSTGDVLIHRPGSRKGDWTVDIIGYNGGALFRQHPEQAKRVAEAVLSAVGFESEWRKYYAEFGHSTVEGGEMSIIPGDPPGPCAPSQFRMTDKTEVPLPSVGMEAPWPGGGVKPSEPIQFTPSEPYTMPPVVNDDCIGEPYHEPPSPVGWTASPGGFGDSETPPAAPKEHRCCGHCKPNAHAPHSDGCPSGFDQPDDEWPTGKVMG